MSRKRLSDSRISDLEKVSVESGKSKGPVYLY